MAPRNVRSGWGIGVGVFLILGGIGSLSSSDFRPPLYALDSYTSAAASICSGGLLFTLSRSWRLGFGRALLLVIGAGLGAMSIVETIVVGQAFAAGVRFSSLPIKEVTLTPLLSGKIGSFLGIHVVMLFVGGGLIWLSLRKLSRYRRSNIIEPKVTAQ